MKKYFHLTPLTGVFVLISLIVSNVSAQTLPTISYQGILENNGAAVNGSDTLKILIYEYATGGTPLYTETQAVNVNNGLFNVLIGSVTPLVPTLDFRSQYYIAISVNGGAESSPRSLFSFSPYAFHALNSDTAGYAAQANVAKIVSGGVVTSVDGEYGPVTLEGNNGITITNNAPNITIGSTGVQALNGAGGIVSITGSGGTTVTNSGSKITISSPVTQTVNGLSGALTIVGTGATTVGDTGATITISTNAITDIQNFDNTINILNPTGPTSTIGLASQNATSGQVLVWNGTAWRPATVSGVAIDSIKNLGDARVYSTTGSLYLGAGDGTHDAGQGENTAVGIQSMAANTTGYSNTAIGYESLLANTSGDGNIALGWSALSSNTSGNDNTSIGIGSLASNTIGTNNIALGYVALESNTTGSYNIAIGDHAYDGGSGSYNIAFGANTLRNEYGSLNIAIGWGSMLNSFHASHIVAVGDSSLMTDGFGSPTQDSATANTAIGDGALRYTNFGAYNTGTGFEALHQNVIGYCNTADGANALWGNTGSYNTAEGCQALVSNAIGAYNTAVGYLALYQNKSGSNNTAVGDSAGPILATGLSNTTCLGSGAQATSSNSVVLGNLNVTTLYCQGAYAATTAASANLVVSATGQIMRSTSSARYKTNIHDLDINTDKLYDLRPVSYTSKIDGKEYFGLVAEDVAKVLPDLAEYARAKDVIPGSTSEEMIPDAVKYPMLSVLLLDELKKEHAKVDDLEKRIEALEAAQKH